MGDADGRLAGLLARAGVGINEVDPGTGLYVRVNDAFCDMVGYRRDELLGRSPVSITHPDDADDSTGRLARFRAGSSTDRRFDKRFVRRDGTVVWAHVTASRSEPTGDGGTILAVIEDFTALRHEMTERRAEEAAGRLQTSALQAAANGIVITDTDGRVQWVNDAFCRLTGYSADEVLGRNLSILKSGKQSDAVYRELWTTISAGQTWQGELVNRRKDGTLYGEEMTITPVLDGRGAVSHFIAIKQDITARRRHAEELRDTEEQLRAAQRMEAVGRLAGGVAHDFNNILSVITSYTELAMMDLREGDPLRADLREVSDAAHRAASLTRQLLAFSRRQVLAPEQVNLGALVDGLSRMLQRLIGEDVLLHVSPCAADLFATRVDRGQIEQVVMNLAVNARDAMPDGGQLRLAVSNAQIDGSRAAALDVAPGEYVELAVTDTGTGMPPEVRERIFEPFFTTKAVGKGTGLGLAMVHGIVKQSRGGISVDTAPGQGTTFRVFLPRHVVEGEKAATPSAPPPSRRGAAGGHESILVVDDEGALRNVVKRALSSAGYRVLLAANPGEALLVCEEHGSQLALVLTDVVMPGMSGVELAKRLAPLCPSAKVLFMSGYNDEMLEHHDVPEQHFLRKPFDRKTLTGKVRSVLDEG